MDLNKRIEIFVKKNGGGRVGGRRGEGVGLGVQGRCEQRSEVFCENSK